MAKVKFKIEKHVPIPADRKYAYLHYPFVEMKKGDSFFVPLSADDSITRLRYAACQYGLRNKLKFSVRKVEGGARCWRIS